MGRINGMGRGNWEPRMARRGLGVTGRKMRGRKRGEGNRRQNEGITPRRLDGRRGLRVEGRRIGGLKGEGEFVGKLGGGGVVWEGCLRFLVRVG